MWSRSQNQENPWGTQRVIDRYLCSVSPTRSSRGLSRNLFGLKRNLGLNVKDNCANAKSHSILILYFWVVAFVLRGFSFCHRCHRKQSKPKLANNFMYTFLIIGSDRFFVETALAKGSRLRKIFDFTFKQISPSTLVILLVQNKETRKRIVYFCI